MLKKILLLFLALSIMLSLCACIFGGDDESKPTEPEEIVETEPVQTEPTEPVVEEPVEYAYYETWYNSLAVNTKENIAVFKIGEVKYDIRTIKAYDIENNEQIAAKNIVAENVAMNENINVPRTHSKYEYTTVPADENPEHNIYAMIDSASDHIFAISDILIEAEQTSIEFYGGVSVGDTLATAVECLGEVELSDYYIDDVIVKNAIIIRNEQNTMILLFEKEEFVETFERVDENGNIVFDENGQTATYEEVAEVMIVSEIALINSSAYDEGVVYEIEEAPIEIPEESANTEYSELETIILNETEIKFSELTLENLEEFGFTESGDAWTISVGVMDAGGVSLVDSNSRELKVVQEDGIVGLGATLSMSGEKEPADCVFIGGLKPGMAEEDAIAIINQYNYFIQEDVLSDYYVISYDDLALLIEIEDGEVDKLVLGYAEKLSIATNQDGEESQESIENQ